MSIQLSHRLQKFMLSHMYCVDNGTQETGPDLHWEGDLPHWVQNVLDTDPISLRNLLFSMEEQRETIPCLIMAWEEGGVNMLLASQRVLQGVLREVIISGPDIYILVGEGDQESAREMIWEEFPWASVQLTRCFPDDL